MGLWAGAWFFVFGTWIWPWVGLGGLRLGVLAYVLCIMCYVLRAISHAILEMCVFPLVLSTCCYVLYAVCCVLRVVRCEKCVYFLCFKHTLSGAMCCVFCTACYAFC